MVLKQKLKMPHEILGSIGELKSWTSVKNELDNPSVCKEKEENSAYSAYLDTLLMAACSSLGRFGFPWLLLSLSTSLPEGDNGVKYRHQARRRKHKSEARNIELLTSQ